MFITISLKKIRPIAVIALIALVIAVLAVTVEDYYVETFETDGAKSAEPLLIIDAGHGGEDGGATVSGSIPESRINLDVALKLQALAGLCGVETVMTRETDALDYPESAKTTRERKSWDQRRRVELVNSTENATLISIHQNKFSTGGPRGPQVIYAKTDGSREFGELAHEKLSSALFPENRRVACPVSESIYLMKMVKCPAILVECGFMSNAYELELLTAPDYQLKLAAVLLDAYMCHTGAA